MPGQKKGKTSSEKIEDIKAHDAVIFDCTNQLQQLEQKLQLLEGMSFVGVKLSSSVKEEIAERAQNKLFYSEELKPELLYVLKALEKLSVIRF